MPKHSEFVANNKGINQIAVGPEIRAALWQVAEKAKAIAQGIATESIRTGDYADSFELREETVTLPKDKYKRPRAAVILENTSPHAVFVEVGHRDDNTKQEIPGHHVLSRTLDELMQTD